MNQTKNWILFSIVLVFITGLLAGTLLGLFIGHNPPPPTGRPPFGEPRMDRPMAPDKMRDDFIQKMTEDLSLTPDQVKKLRKIMEINEKEFVSFRDDMRNKMQEMRGKMSTRIKAILNEEQRKKLDAIEKRMDRFDKGEFGPPDGQRGGGFRQPKGPPPPVFQDNQGRPSGPRGQNDRFREGEPGGRPFRP